MRISTVNDDIALFEMGNELSNEIIDSLTSLDEEDDPSWLLEFGTQLLDGERADDVCAFGTTILSQHMLVCKDVRTSPFASFLRK